MGSSLRITTTVGDADTKLLAATIERFVEKSGLGSDEAFRINLTLEELIANITTHGRREAHEPTVDIEIDVEPGKIVLTITDDGKHFNPTRHPRVEHPEQLDECSIGGLGLELVRQCSSRLHYEMAGRWNRLRIEQHTPATG